MLLLLFGQTKMELSLSARCDHYLFASKAYSHNICHLPRRHAMDSCIALQRSYVVEECLHGPCRK